MTRKLTLKEAAQMLRRSPKTLYGWTSSRKIPHRKVMGKLLFDEQELEQWLDGFRVLLAEGQTHNA